METKQSRRQKRKDTRKKKKKDGTKVKPLPLEMHKININENSAHWQTAQRAVRMYQDQACRLSADDQRIFISLFDKKNYETYSAVAAHKLYRIYWKSSMVQTEALQWPGWLFLRALYTPSALAKLDRGTSLPHDERWYRSPPLPLAYIDRGDEHDVESEKDVAGDDEKDGDNGEDNDDNVTAPKPKTTKNSKKSSVAKNDQGGKSADKQGKSNAEKTEEPSPTDVVQSIESDQMDNDTSNNKPPDGDNGKRATAESAKRKSGSAPTQQLEKKRQKTADNAPVERTHGSKELPKQVHTSIFGSVGGIQSLQPRTSFFPYPLQPSTPSPSFGRAVTGIPSATADAITHHQPLIAFPSAPPAVANMLARLSENKQSADTKASPFSNAPIQLPAALRATSGTGFPQAIKQEQFSPVTPKIPLATGHKISTSDDETKSLAYLVGKIGDLEKSIGDLQKYKQKTEDRHGRTRGLIQIEAGKFKEQCMKLEAEVAEIKKLVIDAQQQQATQLQWAQANFNRHEAILGELYQKVMGNGQ
ncbi:hypothetical protein PT974_00208 [Cladobotryum mycophilum]|uniref:No apical meristem-associated C-terminal domain-containing protein n=1 Tax=Cladobotryum mycophilum TaxID=491253 RepID=A0ABR0T1E4_9HYPO